MKKTIQKINEIKNNKNPYKKIGEILYDKFLNIDNFQGKLNDNSVSLADYLVTAHGLSTRATEITNLDDQQKLRAKLLKKANRNILFIKKLQSVIFVRYLYNFLESENQFYDYVAKLDFEKNYKKGKFCDQDISEYANKFDEERIYEQMKAQSGFHSKFLPIKFFYYNLLKLQFIVQHLIIRYNFTGGEYSILK